MRLRAIRLLIPLLIACWCPPLYAAAPLPLLTDYTHTAWTEVDGAPTGATKFAQGSDGWLWIATPTGLYRYDGRRFKRSDKVYGYPLQSSNIMALTVAPDGAVWIGYRVGGVSVFRKDGAHTYAASGGLNPVGVMHIEVAPDGAVWAAMRDGLAVLAPGAQRFQHLGPDSGLPALGVFQIMFARDGTTWIGTNTGAFFRRRGERRFTHAWPRVALVALQGAPDGTIWGNDFKHGNYRVRMSGPAAGVVLHSEFEGGRVAFDRKGTMWVPHTHSFERKLAPPAASPPEQHLSKSDHISGPILGANFEDREGNIWIASSRGIDRLRPNRLRTMPVARQLEYPALVNGPEGDMWIGDYVADTWRYGPEGRIRREVPGAITASYTAPDGVVWLGSVDGVRRRARDGTLTLFDFPDAVKGLRVHALQQDASGKLWASFSAGKGVYQLVDGRWLKSGGLRDIPELLVTTMTQDDRGNLWMAHPDSQVTVIANGKPSRLSLQDGTVLALHADGQTMWVGSENGVALYRGGHFISLHGERNERFRGVSGIVRLPDGELWLHGAAGLYRIAASAVERMQARLSERNRIARALHDTLLQSMQSLLLSFDAHSRHLKEGTPERTRLDQTLNLAEQLLVEGRDQIMDLRAAATPEVLALTLEEFGKGLAEHRAHAFAMKVHGTPRQLCADVHEGIMRLRVKRCSMPRVMRMPHASRWRSITARTPSSCTSVTTAAAWTSRSRQLAAVPATGDCKGCANAPTASAPRSTSPTSPVQAPLSPSRCRAKKPIEPS